VIKLREVVRSCTHPRVAEAALASIGGAVAARIRTEATRSDTAPGTLVAELVREFDDHCCSSIRVSAEEAMRASEQPVLTGLQHILAHALLRRVLSGRSEAAGQPATIATF
jgi:hypothetical protein